jgi:hypothetical protein
MKNLLYSLLFLFPMLATAQLTDNFSDGDFTNNPSWNGDQSQFIVNSSDQLQLASSGENISYLSTPVVLSDSNEWKIWIKLSFAPSDNNNARIYLFSDQADLKGSLNGYYLKLGENGSLDAIELYRQSGNTSTLICRGTDGLVSASFAIRIRVTRSESGLWKIFADPAGGQNFQLETSGSDNTYNTSGWFGVYCKYTTSNSTKFYFDDIYAGPVIVDIVPPEVTAVSVVSQASVDVVFSEIVEQSSASNIANYTAAPGLGQPLSATPDITDKSLVHLVFAQPFASGTLYTLTIDGVRDVAGNTMQHSEKQFAFYQASTFDILINEIMADPDPPVSLPNFEYVELFNRSNFPVSIGGWTLILGSAEKELDDITMLPGSYLILADEDSRQSLESYGPFAGFSSFIITNTGGDIVLLDSEGRMIHNVSYTEDWYRDNYKKEGGWSLEQIDPMNPCGDANNWKASSDLAGGTPGKQNSVYSANPDLIPPQIQRITVDDSVTLTVYFSEAIDSILMRNPTTYIIDNQIGNPITALPLFPDYRSVTLGLPDALGDGIIYTLSLTTPMKDCAGNLTATEISAIFAIPSIASPLDIILNEILFDPKITGVDFVEIYNRSSKVIDLRNLTLANIDSTSGNLSSVKNITSNGYLFFPGTYLVLTTDPEKVKSEYYTSNPSGFIKMESLPTMNNEDGTIAIAHKNGEIIDWFAYNANMQFALLKSVDGVSLERISASRPTRDVTNWHSAAETVGYATPGYINSQTSGELAGGNPVALSPDIFSPDNDGHNDFLNIDYSFETPGYMINVTVYDASGRLIRNLINNEMCGISGTYSWDGTTNDRQKAAIGYYLVYTEIFDLNGKVKHYKNTTVLGGKL